MIKLPDLSNYQPTEVWPQIKSNGYTVVYLKSSEGLTWNDPTFASHVQGAHSVGIQVGAYHFAHPESNSALDEAKHFVSILKQTPTDLMPVLDLESPNKPTTGITGAYLVTWARDFINYVQSETGKKVMLYTGAWYVNTYGLHGLGDIPLWIAVYGVSAVPQCGDWTSYLMWQFTDAASVSGINGAVDMSYAPSIEALKGNYTQEDFSPMANPTVQLNSTGAVVQKLQADLNTLGAKPQLAIDGSFGPTTLQAVKNFQAKHGLTQDGVVGPNTWAAISKALQPAPTPKPQTVEATPMHAQVNGKDVKAYAIDGDTYVNWGAIPSVKANKLSDGWNFVTPAPTTVDEKPVSVTLTYADNSTQTIKL